ncbi:hypothetical protein R1flu_005537 [Riccia fluitans]|uniref:Reverse transcriptase domain-containing protein n=1 Tax=Riccia fluitans TaxID=41844 RepID=A0ABD1YU45_9MARC
MRQKAKELQHTEVQKLSSLEQLRKDLERFTATEADSTANAAQVLSLSEQISKLQAWQEHRWRLWSRERYLHLGDTNSAYFLRRFCSKCLKSHVRSLVNSEGVRLTSDADMTKEVFSYFSATFAHPSDLSCAQDQDGFLQVFAGKVSMEQAALMDDLPTLQEFTDVLCSSTKGKAPGFDGFNLDAFRVVWDFVGPSYVRATQFCWRTGTFPKGFLEGIITLVPKVVDANSLSKLRPITLLSSIYKLFAKVIAARLSLILLVLVPRQQQGFIVGRSVQNNVLEFALLHEALKREKRSASFLLLDFAKAFDSLRHDFVLKGIAALGFSGSFVRIISSLLEGGFARVIFNSRMTAEFPLACGVRQGYPLAPLLYVLITSSLILHLEVMADAGNLQRVSLSVLETNSMWKSRTERDFGASAQDR